MVIVAERTAPTEIQGMRQQFLDSLDCQFVGFSHLGRGSGDPYLIRRNGEPVGYGVVLNRYDPGHVNEFFLTCDYDVRFGQALVRASGATHVRAQTNMSLQLMLACDLTKQLECEYLLFCDSSHYDLSAPGEVRFADDLEAESNHPDSRYFALWLGNEKVATGGYLAHYNKPYVDVYMEVVSSHQKAGLGSYLVQEIRRTAIANGKLPAARCAFPNVASARTLIRGGFAKVGHLLHGPISSSRIEG